MRIKNITSGMRGVYIDKQLRMVKPGAEIDGVDEKQFELISEWFEQVKSPSDMKKDELIAYAEANGIDLGDASTVKDILATIELAQEDSGASE